ncbi:hypothetical protein Tco_0249178, partial [Tanacetum coccineum]
LNKVTKTLNRFATVVENASEAMTKDVPSAGQATTSPTEGMLKRKKIPKITNCKVLTKKGPITLKINREDGSEEVISNLKTRLDQLTQTEQELKIDLNKPLKEQDPLNELVIKFSIKKRFIEQLR